MTAVDEFNQQGPVADNGPKTLHLRPYPYVAKLAGAM